MSDLADTFKERLYQAAGIDDETITGWFDTHGIGRGTAKTIKDRGGIPSAEKLASIAVSLGKSVDWLLGLTDVPLGEIARAKATGGEQASDFAYIPRYNVTASAGRGHWVDNGEKSTLTLAFRRDWIDRQIGANPRDLSAIVVRGDSMAPSLNDRDTILINHAQTSPQDGIYVLRVDEQILVKRTQRLSRNKMRLISDNPAYAPIEVDFGDDSQVDWAIIGRVVWCGKNL